MLSNWKDSRSLRYAALLLGRSASVERTGFDRANCKLLKLAGTHDFAGKHNSPGRIPGCKTSNTRIKRSRRRAWASAPNLLSAVTASASMSDLHQFPGRLYHRGLRHLRRQFLFLGKQRGYEPQSLHFFFETGQFHLFLTQYFIDILHDQGTWLFCSSEQASSHCTRPACVVKGFPTSRAAKLAQNRPFGARWLAQQ